jgi:pyruvate formate lyase activating enzyme
MARCGICGKTSRLISIALNICAGCIKTRAEEALPIALEAHEKSRGLFGLPARPPRAEEGVKCGLCANGCVIGEGEKGFCGLRKNEGNKLRDLAGVEGVVDCYYDPLPTNCVAAWCCPGCTGIGYPKYSYSPRGPEYGYKNLAVFYGSCTYDCLFCQNWHYRENTRRLEPRMSPSQLAGYVDEQTSCICYFGGDPSSQAVHAIKTSRLALEKAGDRVLRICFESNGNFSKPLLKKAAELALESGGCIKFDLKAWDENLNLALCGVSNRATLENFEWLADYGAPREEPPFLVASTLLVPGYVDVVEVENLARFIASLNPEIPYSLLAFHPQYRMQDLPTTSRKHAYECLEAAEKHLRNVRLGNVHLLS